MIYLYRYVITIDYFNSIILMIIVLHKLIHNLLIIFTY